MGKTFSRPRSLSNEMTHYCPGCTHGLVHRLVAETIDELGIRDNTVGVAPVGCAVMIYNYLNCDFQEAAHGRAPAVATGIKRTRPDLIVFTYQGDGDLASIGAAEIVHAAARGENITVIFVNNAVYGMTGGQMAPTTLIGQTTSTTPQGRTIEKQGHPIKVSEMLATLDGAVYVERVAVHDIKNIRHTKKSIIKAFQNQIDKKGFSLIEILSTCPVGWKKTPYEAMKSLEKDMIPVYPLGVKKDI